MLDTVFLIRATKSVKQPCNAYRLNVVIHNVVSHFITPKFKMIFFDCRIISLHQRRVSEVGDILTT